MRPGTTQLTVTPSPARSCASARVSPTSPALAATTCGRPAAPVCAERPPMLTIAPAPPARRLLRHAFEQTNAPSRITPVISRQRARSISSSAVTSRTAALLTRMSIRPRRAAGRVDHAGDRCGIGHVGEHGERADRRARPISAATASISACDRRAFTITAGAAVRERQRDRATDVAAGAGHERDPAASPRALLPAASHGTAEVDRAVERPRANARNRAARSGAQPPWAQFNRNLSSSRPARSARARRRACTAGAPRLRCRPRGGPGRGRCNSSGYGFPGR